MLLVFLMLLVFYAFGDLCFWCSMLLVFSVMVSLFPGSGVSYYGFSLSLSLSLLSLFLSLFLSLSFSFLTRWSMVWSLCSDALVLLLYGLFVLMLWCFYGLISLF
ncbi:hypothetical protein EDC96DRAFT_200916 [Choanephora cucurbitarum]|nr:hypothetical protein EDC96DRAFT_200916 [Choanephora cucurbitarum]